MGIDDDIARRSSRLVARFESLRTGATPYQRFYSSPRRNKCTVMTVAANISYRDSQNYLADIRDLEKCDTLSIIKDINLDRSSPTLEEPDDMAEVETRVNDMQSDVNGLKTDVTTLKTDMTTMNDKLDDLIQSIARLNSNVLQSANNSQSEAAQEDTPPKSNQTPYSTSMRNHHTRSSASRMSPEEFLQCEMNRDKFDFPHAGKYLYGSDFSTGRVLHKPYMYLYREGVSTIKQKVEVRQTMTVIEYIDAMLALLADNRAYHRDDFVDIMDHMRKVTRDAMERPWHAVRRWTQYVWDSIEAGAFTWADHDIIQEERVRMSLTATSNIAGNNIQTQSNGNANRKNHGAQEVICRGYNTRAGCQFRDSHMDGQVFALHNCTYCDSIGRACSHSVRECERRLAHTRNDNNTNYSRQRFTQCNQYGPPHQNQQVAFNQPPKNGY